MSVLVKTEQEKTQLLVSFPVRTNEPIAVSLIPEMFVINYFLAKAKSTQLFPQVGVSKVEFSAAKRAAALSTSF